MPAEVNSWLLAGRSSEDAAMSLGPGHARSAVSRFYYAAYSAVHAILIECGQTPPDRGNWPHEGLGAVLESTLTRGTQSVQERDARLYKDRLVELYNLRIQADYGPLRSVGTAEATRSRRLAGPIVRLAERIVHA